MSSDLSKSYFETLSNLKEKIRLAKQKASLAVNAELIAVYWEIGNTILDQQKNEGWGAKIISQLSMDLKMEFPDMKGFSKRNLVYMQTFSAAYQWFEITQPVVAQLDSNEQQKENVQGVLAQIETSLSINHWLRKYHGHITLSFWTNSKH